MANRNRNPKWLKECTPMLSIADWMLTFYNVFQSPFWRMDTSQYYLLTIIFLKTVSKFPNVIILWGTEKLPNMWHDQGKWVTCRKFQFQFSYTTFSKCWCKPHYNWISGYRVMTDLTMLTGWNKGIWTLFLPISQNIPDIRLNSSWSCNIVWSCNILVFFWSWNFKNNTNVTLNFLHSTTLCWQNIIKTA